MADKDRQPQQADFDKAWENIKAGKTMPGEPDMGPTSNPKGYSPKDVSNKKPEPTFKSDVDDIVSKVKKVDRKINDAFDPIREVTVKAAGKEEPGILSKYSSLTKFVPEKKKKGGKVKCMAKGGMTASKRADGIAQRGKTKGKIV